MLAGYEILAPGFEMALNHYAEDARVALCDLRHHRVADINLFFWFFAAVAVAKVDHDARRNAGGGEIPRAPSTDSES